MNKASHCLARRHVDRRFAELVVKHALGTATPEEEAKLERYQRLRREMDGTSYTSPDQARREYADSKMIKALKRLTRKGPENVQTSQREHFCFLPNPDVSPKK